MKERKLKIRYMMFLLICCSLFTACGSKGKDALVGKWEAVEHEGTVLIFNDDGTYMYTTTNGNNASGSYKVINDEIQMTSDASGLGADLDKVSGLHKFVLEGNTLSFDELGLTYTEYIKSK